MGSNSRHTRFWKAALKLVPHTGKMLLIPLIANMLTFAANMLLAISDDGMIDEQEFHNLLQGASSLQILILTLVMALLKIRKP